MLRKQHLVLLLLSFSSGLGWAHDGRPEPPPKHGGVVFTSGEFDVEGIFQKPKGHYQVYFDDASGQEVSADLLSGVELSIRGAAARPERIPLHYDNKSKSWLGSGSVANSPMRTASLSYALIDIPVQTSIPFAATFHAELQTTPTVAKAGESVQLEFAVKDYFGKNTDLLDIVHEKPMHLMVVSSDLADFSHIHPEPVGGVLRVPHIFPHSGDYRLYADFTPMGGNNVVQAFDLKVQGPPRPLVPLVPTEPMTATLDGIRMTVTADRPIRTGEDILFSMTVVNTQTGMPVHDLQRYLGAWAHIAIISQDTQDFLHVHPIEEALITAAGAESNPNVIRAATGFRRPGLYKWWAEVQREGKVVTFPFVFRVEAGSVPVTALPQVPTGAVLVKVSSAGFEPSRISAVAGKPVKLVFFRPDAQNCAREVVFPGLGIRRELPPGESVAIEVTPSATGSLSFTCGMKMFRGELLVQ